MGKREELIKLRKKALEDDLPLKKGATKLVFGAGNPEAEILMLGEGPGYWEDQKGIPFVGNAGAFLNQLLMLIGLDRDQVFISNMVMYRPPGNRDPTPDELAAFKTYVDGIIEIIKPKVIVTLGRFSMAKFIPGVYISSVHGKLKEVSWGDRQLTVVPMYHPAAGLRNLTIKESLKRDFLDLKTILEESGETKKKKKKEKVQEVKQMPLI